MIEAQPLIQIKLPAEFSILTRGAVLMRYFDTAGRHQQETAFEACALAYRP